jgi:hypothetical protein
MKSKSQIEAVNTHLGTGMSQSAAPIDKVPYEILGCIFKDYVEMDQSPWGLTLVSKSWRLAAMADPNLWRYVLIKGHYDLGRFHLARWKFEGSVLLTSGQRAVCTSPQDLAAVIGRAGSANLDIRIFVALRDNLFNPNNLSLLSLLEDVFKHPISSRVAKLFLDSHLEGPQENITDYFSKIFLGPYSALEDLIIHGSQLLPWAGPLLSSVQTTAPKLKNLQLGLYVLSPSCPPDSVRDLWERITSLILRDNAQIDSILPQCSRLTHFQKPTRGWPKHDTDRHILANIQSLDLKCDPRNLCRLYMPSLQRLEVGERFDEHAWKTMEPFELPNLTSLHAACYDLTWITFISAPQLRDLELDISKNPKRSCSCHNPINADLLNQKESSYPECIFNLTPWGCLARLSKLTLNSRCSEAAYFSIMGTITQAQILKISTQGRFGDQTTVLRILDRLAQHSELGRLSQLETFILGSEYYPIHSSKEELSSRIIPFVKLRKQIGMELARFDVHWSDVSNNCASEILQYAM